MTPTTEVLEAPVLDDEEVTDDVLAEDEVLLDDMLVEEVSIDGMCGVY